MSEDEARAVFRAVRFEETEGRPVCPRCGCDAVLEFKCRPIFKCKRCEAQFSLTSGTLFNRRKMSMRDILTAVVMFVNGVSGLSALKLTRDLGCAYKTAFVLLQKLREAMDDMRVDRPLTGKVEADGLWTGGYIKPKNIAAERIDRRKGPNPKRFSIVTMRERRPGGRSISVVVKQEGHALQSIIQHVDPSATIYTDEQPGWSGLTIAFDEHKVVNHNEMYVARGGVHTNWVESHNARIRRAIKGVYHHISGRYIERYAQEMCWREDFRRVDNGTQFSFLLGRASRMGPSARLAGYWQRHLRAT